MDVRTRILDAALGVLAEGGPGALTQPRVARAAGVRQGHLTYYFPRRDALLQAVAYRSLERLASGMLADVQRGALKPASIPDAFAAAITDKRRSRTMLALIASAERDAAVRRGLRRFIRELRGRLAEVLRAGGLPARPADVAFFHSVLVGAAVLHLARDDAAARREARDVIRRARAGLEET